MLNEIRVCMDIGSRLHRVAVGLSGGQLLEEFDIHHTPAGIDELFNKIDSYEKQYQLPVTVAMEAYNGYARPIDQRVLSKGYRLLNVNNNKLAQYKKVFPGAAKTDVIDTRKMFELFTLSDQLPLAKPVLQEVKPVPVVNEKLKRLTRRRRALVNDKIVIMNRLQADVIACMPGLLDITKQVDNLWFLNFFTSCDDVRKLSKLREKRLVKIPCVGKKFLPLIQAWQKDAAFSQEVEWVSDMMIDDAKRLLELHHRIRALEKEIETLSTDSEIALHIQSIPGFGKVSAAELAGEIGTLTRFKKEANLAIYLGMAVLDNSSGNYRGTKQSKHVNCRAKKAMMVAVARHIMLVKPSKAYYDKKRSEGKKHNQAIRSLARHMVRVIWSLLKNHRDYKILNEVK
jgi:transposase